MKYLKSYTEFGSISESLDTRVGRTGQLCLHKTDSGNLASYVNDGILKSKYSNMQRGSSQPGIFFVTGTDESALFSEMERLGRGDSGMIIGKYLDLADTAQWNVDYEFEAGAVSHFLVKNLMTNMPAELGLYYRADKTLYQKFSETDWQDLVQYVAIDAADEAYDNDYVDGHLYLIRSSQDQVLAADMPEHETHGPTLFRFWAVPFGQVGNVAHGDHYNDLFWAKNTELRRLRDKIDSDVLEYMTSTGEPFAIKYMAELSQADRFPDRVWLKESGAWKEYSFHEDVKILKNKGLKEYYSFANTLLIEFLNPELSYDYGKIVRDNGELMFELKYEDDPYFVVTLKKGGLNENYYWILDFYFPEKDNGFDKQKELKGKNYLDTVSKIFKDEILPFIEKNQYPILYFKAYSKDSYGNLRMKVFSKIVDKFVNKEKFNIEKRSNEFIIKK